MKKFLKGLAVALVVVVLGSMLVACGNNEEATSSPAASASADASPSAEASASPSAQ